MYSKCITGLALLLGLASFINGLYMTLAPNEWYWQVPGVTARGFYNQHFIRDIGFHYLLIAAAFLYGAYYEKYRLQLWLLPSAWLVSHALFHVWEVIVGLCGPEYLIIDFAGVSLPAILALWLSYASYRSGKLE